MGKQRFLLGIVGARGHTGSELIKLLANHPYIDLAFVSSRELAGQSVAKHNPAYMGLLNYARLEADEVADKNVDVVILALPNGKAQDYVNALNNKNPQTLIIDLSADYRFDSTWYYGLPELTRKNYNGQKRISNPGCYATAMQLAIAPLTKQLAGPPVCFGVSGYSGAGTTPSERNNPELLRDNLMPYSLTGHIHEREVSEQLALPVEFMPHVAAHFRGITLTANLWLQQRYKREEIIQLYREYYSDKPLIEIIDQAPWVSQIAGKHGVKMGGFALSLDKKRVVVVATLDNLLKGAATQAVQNLNIALGLDELTAIATEGKQV